ncbi:MAG: DUF5698 domain-containing protein [Actinomycetia bacterium]|nr:DUF5698 domain-containing protein [Actinomycetes bacterium]
MQIAIWTISIFLAMVFLVSMGTLRLVTTVKGKKAVSAIIGFLEAALSITVVAKIIQNASNTIMVLSYAVGFAIGLFLGMVISEKLSRDIYSTNIMSRESREIGQLLRENGFGVTCYNDSGREGNLRILNIISKREHLLKLKQLTGSMDQKAFIISHTLSESRGGFGNLRSRDILLLNNGRSD